MTDSPAPAKQKKPLWRRLLKWTLRAVILLIVLGIAAYAITDYWAAHAINAEVARIRAAGEPLTFADLDALAPKVDRAQDAGPYYAAAAELVNADYELDDANCGILFGHKPLPSPVPAETLAWAHRGIDQNRLALDLIDRGSALPGCNSGIELQYGIAVALPHISRERPLLNVVSLRSHALAVEGQGDEAVKSVISSLGLLRTLDRQPVLIDVLVQVALLSFTYKDAGFVLEYGHLSDTALQKLDAALRHTPPIQLRQMFIAERVYHLEIMRDVLAYGVNGVQSVSAERNAPPPLPEREMGYRPGIASRVKAARSLPNYARFITAATGEYPAIIDAVQNVANTCASTWGIDSRKALSQAMVLYGITLSVHRSTLIAIQIERFRLAHAGQLPDSLAQLPNASDLPKDPFTGNPLLYVKTEGGYCVFSAGRGHPEDSTVDRDKDPVEWSRRWGTHIRTTPP